MTTPWPFDPLPMFGFDAAMIDPPWQFALWSAAGEAKSPQAQYDTMDIDAIAALPVGNLLRAGAVVWLWSTWPLVARGDHARILRGWGIEPLTGGVWAKRTATGKLRWGPGYILRTVCEPFLIGGLAAGTARGPGLKNMIETAEAAALDGLAREHSRKPDEAYSFMEALTPDATRLDLFSRQVRPGWVAWGNEIHKFVEGAREPEAAEPDDSAQAGALA